MQKMAQSSHVFLLAFFIAFAVVPETTAAGLGGNCTQIKCDDNMKCGINKMCECISSYHGDGDKCKYNYHEPCSDNSTCGSPSMYCLKEKCHCLNGSHSFKDGICKGSMGALCDEDKYCLSDLASCSSNGSKKICQCKQNYTQNGEKCLAPLGKMCSPSSGCQDKNANCTTEGGKNIYTCNYGFDNKTKTSASSGSIIYGSIIAAAFALLLRSM